MTPEFREQLKTKLAPMLRADGFVGSGVTFRRLRGEVIHLLHVQGSTYGGSCCVSLAIHLTFLPTLVGRPTDSKKITENHCEFRKRLAPEGQSDCWWKYGSDEHEATRSVDDLVDLIRRVALPHFDRFGKFPQCFENISPLVLASGDFRALPGNMGAPRAALVMARISAHLGRPDRAREFAEVGLASMSGHAGSGIARDLESLAGRGAP